MLLAYTTSFQAINNLLAVYLSGLREGDRLLYIILLKKVVNEKIINGFISSLTGGGEFQRVSVLNRKIQW